MKHKKAAVILTGTTGLSYVTYKKISNDIFNQAFKREDRSIILDKKYAEWANNSKCVKVKINSFDNLQLVAYNFHNNDTNNYIILVHGINGSKESMLNYAYEFDKLGYNTLVIDQRSAGESEGDYYTYGFKESQDIPLWINYLKEKNNDVKIVLFGISMGAATIMMSTAYKLDESVKCIVEDSGFSSLEEELKHYLNRDYNRITANLVLNFLKSKMENIFGIKMSDVSIKNVLDNNEIPILFIHGEQDKLVPFDMAKILYNHNKGIKKYYPVPDVDHCKAYEDEYYFTNIDNFIKEYL